MPVLPLDCHLPTCPLKTPHIPSSYSNEQTTRETKAINNWYIYIYIYIYISHVNVTQTVPDISPLMPMHQDPLLVITVSSHERQGVSGHRHIDCLCNIFVQAYSKERVQRFASLAFVRWIHRWPMDSPHKGSAKRKVFPRYDVNISTRLYHVFMSWRHYFAMPLSYIPSWMRAVVYNCMSASNWGFSDIQKRNETLT